MAEHRTMNIIRSAVEELRNENAAKEAELREAMEEGSFIIQFSDKWGCDLHDGMESCNW